PATMEPYIVKGANLVINEGLADQETVTVTAVTTSTFTAKFAQTHKANFTIGDNSITLSHAAKQGTVVVQATPSADSASRLILGTDYTLGSAANGNTTITFTAGHIPANGTTINTTYDYVASPAYALEATGGSASLNGVTGLTLNGSNLLVRVRNGLD